MKTNFTQIPNQILTFNLTHPELKIIIYLFKWRNAGRTDFSYTELGRECFISKSTVNRNLTSLKEKGLITIVSGALQNKVNSIHLTHRCVAGDVSGCVAGDVGIKKVNKRERNTGVASDVSIELVKDLIKPHNDCGHKKDLTKDIKILTAETLAKYGI